jgi:hypothetical protein
VRRCVAEEERRGGAWPRKGRAHWDVMATSGGPAGPSSSSWSLAPNKKRGSGGAEDRAAVGAEAPMSDLCPLAMKIDPIGEVEAWGIGG